MIPALDGFRAYAILTVVVLHLLLVSGALHGKAGAAFGIAVWGIAGNVIDVFFILSGFLLFLPIVARGGLGNLRDYAVRRAVRLLPAYWLALAATFAVVIPLDHIAAPSIGDVAIHATALQTPARMLDADLAVGFGVNGPIWMISVIVGFYFVLPLIARPYARHPLIGLAIAAALTVAWKLAVVEFSDSLTAIEGSAQPWLIELIAFDQLPGWAFSFALGMTGAWAYLRFRERRPRTQLGRPALLVLVAAGSAYVVCAYFYGRQAASINLPTSGSYARGDPWLGLASSTARALVLAAVVVGPLWLQRPFATRSARKLSELSYGLYLIHFPIALAIGIALLELPTDGSPSAVTLWLVIVISLSLAYAELSRRYLERPLVDWSRRWARRQSGSPSSSTRLAGIESRPDAREEPRHRRGEARLPA